MSNTRKQFTLIDTSCDDHIQAITHAENKDEAKAKFIACSEVDEIDFESHQFVVRQSFINII